MCSPNEITDCVAVKTRHPDHWKIACNTFPMIGCTSSVTLHHGIGPIISRKGRCQLR